MTEPYDTADKILIYVGLAILAVILMPFLYIYLAITVHYRSMLKTLVLWILVGILHVTRSETTDKTIKKILSLIYAAPIAATVVKTIDTPIIYYIISLTTTMGIIGLHVGLREKEHTTLATVEIFSMYLLIAGTALSEGAKTGLTHPVEDSILTSSILVTVAVLQVCMLLFKRIEKAVDHIQNKIYAFWERDSQSTAETLIAVTLAPAFTYSLAL